MNHANLTLTEDEFVAQARPGKFMSFQTRSPLFVLIQENGFNFPSTLSILYWIDFVFVQGIDMGVADGGVNRTSYEFWVWLGGCVSFICFIRTLLYILLKYRK